ncbi:MAG: hypothetical protein RL299_934 [Pseudomonadota bacterium]|jgi:hypothetical protein
MNGEHQPIAFGTVAPVEFSARMLSRGMTAKDAMQARPAMLDLAEALGGDRNSPFMSQMDTAALYLLALYIAHKEKV